MTKKYHLNCSFRDDEGFIHSPFLLLLTNINLLLIENTTDRIVGFRFEDWPERLLGLGLGCLHFKL